MADTSPRQRVLDALDHKPGHPVPFSWGFGINPPAFEALARHLHMDADALQRCVDDVDDIRWVQPDYIGPQDRNRYDADVRTDVWGVRWKYQSFGEGGYEEQFVNPLADAESIEDIERYRFPEACWWDMSRLKQKIDAINSGERRAIKLGNGNIFECATFLRGFENILVDTIAEPELLHALLRKCTDYFLGYFEAALGAADGLIDIVFTADDVGGQQGLLLSPDTIREFIAPYHKELNDLVHRHGAKVMYHSCGSVMEALPILIDCGVDILESLQFYTKGMEMEPLKRQFGDALCFHGGASVQKTLVSGTPQQVQAEVERLIRVLGEGGGFILAPAHHIQAGTPPENILAMLKAAGRALP